MSNKPRKDGMSRIRIGVGLALVMVLLKGMVAADAVAENPPRPAPGAPNIEDYATIEGYAQGAPIYSFGNICYVYGISPDQFPGVTMQEGNTHPAKKIQPKKSWEIKHNLLGSEHEMMPRSAKNDKQAFLPIHLIDGDAASVWSSWGNMVPDGRPEWIRIDLPAETVVGAVAFQGGPWPKEIEIKLSRDAWHWESVYASKDFTAGAAETRVVDFPPRPAKQIWIVANSFTARGAYGGYIFSLGEVQVRNPAGDNLALVSRGAGVTVSSTSYSPMNDRLTQDALWGPLQYDLGNKWVRFVGLDGTYNWATTEREKGKLEVDPRTAAAVDEAARNGLNVIMVLDWEANPLYSGAEMAAGARRYLEYLVRRFKGRVAYYELRNEWNGAGGPNAGDYMKNYFEPVYAAVKEADPQAKILLGGVAGFIPSLIYDCLGQPWEVVIHDGKLRSIGGNQLLVNEDVIMRDAVVSVDALNDGEFAIILRYQDPQNYLAAFYDQGQSGTVVFRECVDGKLGPKDWKYRSWVVGFGPRIHMEARVEGGKASLSISDGTSKRTANHVIQSPTLQGAGLMGLYQLTANQEFDNFDAVGLDGRTLLKEEFNGADGSLPAGWRKILGGANPVQKGWASRIDGVVWHPCQPADETYFPAIRQFKNKCASLGFQGRFFSSEIYAGSIYPPGPAPQTQWACSPLLTEIGMAKFLAQSVVGHNGLDIEAGPCHPHFTGFPHPQSLCRVPWPVQTINPCQPSVAYYVWRTLATALDDFYPGDFPVVLNGDKKFLHFTFQRGDAQERMLAAWIPPAGVFDDRIVEAKTDVTLPGFQAGQAWAIDIMNGTQQELNLTRDGNDTVLKRMLIKDYPTLIRIVN